MPLSANRNGGAGSRHAASCAATYAFTFGSSRTPTSSASRAASAPFGASPPIQSGSPAWCPATQ